MHQHLNHLFSGHLSVCCEAAGDTDGDGLLRLNDAVFLLGYLFLGGEQPAAPFPECRVAPTGELSCWQSSCR